MGNITVAIPVVYEDNQIIVVEKPVNVPSQRDESNDEDIQTLLKKDIKKRYNKPGNVFLGIVHRLDRPAGGIMVFAKTSKAASRLSEEMRAGGFKKTYLAVIRGKAGSAEGELRDVLIKDKTANKVKYADISVRGAKPALLKYKVIGFVKELSLVRINLITGRSHQIRVQFSGIGNPLYGDQKYGPDVNRRGQQLALWSAEIVFHHPVTKEEMTFKSIPPDKKPWNIFPDIKNSLDLPG